MSGARGSCVPVREEDVLMSPVFLSVFCSRRNNSIDVLGTLNVNTLIRTANTIHMLPSTFSS